ncbi:helix-turn-helix domain-containing protein [Lentzea terrae]|uniref:helix-turn-helix domain-containing protein n=1 Tax=Lentzea terrae TaxID=2200761 RepID=UPI000DD2E993|nr:helix-turn-helix domain-containing protein [Lentzea terrae]
MTPSTAYSRDPGDELRRLRETCTGLKSNELAKKLGWDPSKISTIEHGKARASEIDLIQFLSMCGKDIDYVNDFKRRYQYAFDEYFVQLSGNLRTVGLAESTARTIISYETLIVPGLFQDIRVRREGVPRERDRRGRADTRTRAVPDRPPGDPAATRSAGLLVLHP